MYDENRTVVPLSRISPIARQAVLAIEDHAFYQHGPLDLSSIIRALLADLRAGTTVQGGSTITQQLVKQTETGDAETITRKIHEAQDAVKLSKKYTKDQILDAYLNTVYLGGGAYGIQAAAEFYFGIPASKLNLVQGATLAGMIQQPNGFNPLLNPKASLHRRNQVLGRMHQLGWITPERYAKAVAQPIKVSAAGQVATITNPQPFFVQFVRYELLNDPRYAFLGNTPEQRLHVLLTGGLKIHTTLNTTYQRYAMEAIRARMWGSDMPQSAVVSMDPETGAVVTMANGNWSTKNHVDLTTDIGGSGRTAGSSFKAFTLATALEQGISPEAVFSTKSPMTIPNCGGGATWTVSNAEGAGNMGQMNLWQATAGSINVVFAQLINEVGPSNVVAVAKKMGITTLTPQDAVCPLTLGVTLSGLSPYEMTSGYSTLANMGSHCQPYVISSIVSRTGGTMFRQKPDCTQVIPRGVASEETRMLEGVITGGTGTAANIGRPAAGKTGTGENFIDAWFMGYVPQIVTGVWVGWAKAEIPMLDIPGYGEGFGGTLAAPIWHDYMARVVQGMPVEQFPYAPPPPPKLAKVPNVVGLSQAGAVEALARYHLTAIVKLVNSNRPAGIVVAQSPGGGASIPLGSGVHISVSNGHPPGPKGTTVPNVVGKSAGVAAAALKAAGFVVSITYQAAPASKVGLVLAQTPGGGTKSPKGSTVTIVVGKTKASPPPSPSPSPTKTKPSPSPTKTKGEAPGVTGGPVWPMGILLLPAGLVVPAWRIRRRPRRR